MSLPEKHTIPKDRIPKPWSQGVYDCCVAASITKVLEVINYVKTGTYTMLSKGYVYGRHSRPDKTQGGMDYTYTIPELLKRGTVPERMCHLLDEIPTITEKLKALPNIAELDTEAEKTKIKSYIYYKGDARFYDNVKKCLYEHNMPLVGNMVGKRHCTVIVGWDGDKLLYHDHKGDTTLYKGKFNEAYYLDGGIGEEEIMPEIKYKDVDEYRWSYDAIKFVSDAEIMKGTKADTFEPTKAVTREELATVLYRIMKK